MAPPANWRIELGIYIIKVFISHFACSDQQPLPSKFLRCVGIFLQRQKLIFLQWLRCAARFNKFTVTWHTFCALPQAASAVSAPLASYLSASPTALGSECAKCGNGAIAKTQQRSTIQPQCQVQLARTIFPKQLFLFAAAVGDGRKQCELSWEMPRADSTKFLQIYLPRSTQKNSCRCASWYVYISLYIILGRVRFFTRQSLSLTRSANIKGAGCLIPIIRRHKFSLSAPARQHFLSNYSRRCCCRQKRFFSIAACAALAKSRPGN